MLNTVIGVEYVVHGGRVGDSVRAGGGKSGSKGGSLLGREAQIGACLFEVLPQFGRVDFVGRLHSFSQVRNGLAVVFVGGCW